jgi:hypothetical protein
VLGAFESTYVEIESAADGCRGLDDREDGFAGKPERRTEHPREPEDQWRPEESVQAEEPAHGRAGDAGLGRLGPGAEPPVDGRLQRLDQKVEVPVSRATALDWICERAVLRQSLRAHVGNADHDGL